MMMTQDNEITLEQLLSARERRATKQIVLVEEYKLPLISFTVNIPGKYKRTALSRNIFDEGLKTLMKKLEEQCIHIVYYESYGLDTGNEAYIVANTDKRTLKEHVINIENSHPLGRIFDFDVISQDGNAISRDELGYQKRKCLICDQDAHSCGRSRKHPLDVLIKEIQSAADAYFQ